MTRDETEYTNLLIWVESHGLITLFVSVSAL